MEDLNKPSNIEESSNPERIEYIAQKFIQIPYPLSAKGEVLKEKIINNTIATEELIQELPTVENPRPELFGDLDASIEVIEQVFGSELSNIQVTKGCHHQCTFCAAGSGTTVQTMPFPAVVKIAEAKRSGERDLREKCDEWLEFVQKETGLDIETLRRLQMRDSSPGISFDEMNIIAKKVSAIFIKHPFRKFWEEYNEYGAIRFSSDIEHSKVKGQPNAISFWSIPLGQYTSSIGNLYESEITNYYDSDPFDYKDRNFCHKDGSPADFGDVARILTSKERAIHITTAGWSETDRVAQQAAEKVVKLGRTFIVNPRLSVNQFEVRARKDKKIYLSDILNSIKTFEQMGITVLIFDDGSDPEYTKEVVEPIRKYIDSHKYDGHYLVHYESPTVSLYSGAMRQKEKDDHHDVMSCMPGFHIWPDGTIAKQEKIVNKPIDSPFTSPKGSRPTPIGKQLWKLKK